MKAIILAAGMGSRLGSKADGRPKALLRIGDRALIQHQLEALSSEGVGPVAVVIGHGGDQIRTVLHDAVEYVVNEQHAETNSLFSLWLAREWLDGDILLLNSDLLFHPEILRRVLATPGSALAYDSTSHHGGEQTKVGLIGRRVIDLGKDFPATGARGENLGLIKLNAEAAQLLRKRAEAIIEKGDVKVWVTEAVRSILAEVEVTGVNVAGLPWAEVDFPYDLEQARKVVWPAIEAARSPWRRIWRKLRWAAWLLLAIAFVAVVTLLSSLFGPASVDWETLAPRDGVVARIQRAEKGPQKWWLVAPNDTLTFEAEGGVLTRLEARGLLMRGSTDTAVFALGILVDGAPYAYQTDRAPIDTEALASGGAVVSERDRKTFTLAPGQHRLGVTFLAGNVTAVLVRVRQPEEK